MLAPSRPGPAKDSEKRPAQVRHGTPRAGKPARRKAAASCRTPRGFALCNSGVETVGRRRTGTEDAVRAPRAQRAPWSAQACLRLPDRGPRKIRKNVPPKFVTEPRARASPREERRQQAAALQGASLCATPELRRLAEEGRELRMPSVPPARNARLGVRKLACAFQTGARERFGKTSRPSSSRNPARGQARAKKGGSKLPHSKELRSVHRRRLPPPGHAGLPIGRFSPPLSPQSANICAICGPLFPAAAPHPVQVDTGRSGFLYLRRCAERTGANMHTALRRQPARDKRPSQPGLGRRFFCMEHPL